MRPFALLSSVLVVAAACGGQVSSGIDSGTDSGPIVVDAGPPIIDTGIKDQTVPDVTPPPPVDSGPPPSCGGTCVPQAPSGWSYVLYSQQSRPPCPTDYATPTDTVEGFTASAATCDCNCSTSTAPTCTVYSASINSYGTSSCGGLTTYLTNTSSCNAQSYTYSSSTSSLYVRPTAYAYATGGSCGTPTPAKTLPAVTIDDPGRTCSLTTPPTTVGCKSSESCVPGGTTPFSMCVWKAGYDSCPSGFPNTHQAGTGLNDTRDCTTTGCYCYQSSTCDTPKMNFYSDSSCSSSTLSVTADGTCQSQSGTTLDFDSYSITASLKTNQCYKYGNFSATGTVTLSNVRTICCM